jgi:hypothetical protein
MVAMWQLNLKMDYDKTLFGYNMVRNHNSYDVTTKPQDGLQKDTHWLQYGENSQQLRCDNQTSRRTTSRHSLASMWWELTADAMWQLNPKTDYFKALNGFNIVRCQAAAMWQLNLKMDYIKALIGFNMVRTQNSCAVTCRTITVVLEEPIAAYLWRSCFLWNPNFNAIFTSARHWPFLRSR